MSEEKLGLSVFEAKDVEAVYNSVETVFKKHESILPKKRDALIFLKPNFNNDLNTLTATTTDLRVIAAVLSSFKKRGYDNIVVADGPNTGAFHSGLNILSRLKVDALAKHFGARCLDLNREPTTEINLQKGTAKIAKICKDVDFFINIPKIKSHMEFGMSCALKNLIGCLSGFEKRKFHDNPIENIFKLNEQVKPNLHIVDGIISMGGQGPGKGVPLETNLIIAGTNPFLIDLFVAKICGFSFEEVKYLQRALEMKVVSEEDVELIEAVDRRINFIKPKRNRLAEFMLKNFFVYIRYSPLFDGIMSSKWSSKILVPLGIRQDVYSKQDPNISAMKLNKEKCNQCKKCVELCPMRLKILDKNFDFQNGCIKCLYCFLACPENAIEVEGDLGYLKTFKAE